MADPYRYRRAADASAEDDAAFAAELGLSIDSLLRLAGAWRRYRDPTMLPGAPRPVSASDVANAKKLPPSSVDLSAVDDKRRSEVARRIDVIYRYLLVECPQKADRVSAAAEFGVTPNRFTRIVRKWILDRNPLDIPGATTPRWAWRKNETARMRISAILDSALAALGPESPVTLVFHRVKMECRAEGLNAPGLKRIYQRVAEIRKGDGGCSTNAAPDLATCRSLLRSDYEEKESTVI